MKILWFIKFYINLNKYIKKKNMNYKKCDQMGNFYVLQQEDLDHPYK